MNKRYSVAKWKCVHEAAGEKPCPTANACRVNRHRSNKAAATTGEVAPVAHASEDTACALVSVSSMSLKHVTGGGVQQGGPTFPQDSKPWARAVSGVGPVPWCSPNGARQGVFSGGCPPESVVWGTSVSRKRGRQQILECSNKKKRAESGTSHSRILRRYFGLSSGFRFHYYLLRLRFTFWARSTLKFTFTPDGCAGGGGACASAPNSQNSDLRADFYVWRRAFVIH